METGAAMRSCSLVLGLLMVGLTGYYTAVARQVRPRHPWTFWPVLAIGVLIAAGLVLESAGVLPVHLYALMLLWLLVVGFAQFFSFLLLTGRTTDPAS